MDFNELATQCAPMVAPQTLAAIVKTESNFNPLAININKGYRLERQPKNKDEAVATAKWLINNHFNIDMGLGQVNSSNLPKVKLTVEDAFDPCKNLAASAVILHGNFQAASKYSHNEQSALLKAISAYNTGSFSRGFSNGYVNRVVGNSVSKTNSKKLFKAESPQPIKVLSSNKSSQSNANAKQVQVVGEDELATGVEALVDYKVYARPSEQAKKIMVY